MKDISKSVKLRCPICGNDEFASIDCPLDNLFDAPDTAVVQCSDCKNKVTKKELIEENQEQINACIEEIKQEFIKEANYEIAKALKK